MAFNSGAIIEAMSTLDYEINTNILPSIKKCNKLISNLREFNNISSIYDKLEEILDILNDVQMDIEIPEEEENLEELNDKINKINKLKIKYASTINEILEYKENLSSKLEKLEYSDENLNKLKEEKEIYINQYFESAKLLSQKRHEIAEKIEKDINFELKELNMKDASFRVSFSEKEGFSEKGIDDIEFMIKTNVGQDYSKLARIASGGEISRVMLALKIVFSKVDKLETLVFDEIDAGISGDTVELVAKKLKLLSKNVQVICVTHSPNIAAKASEQFLIYKESKNDKTLTKLKKLDENERVEEIARIISGSKPTKALLEHVKEMMK